MAQPGAGAAAGDRRHHDQVTDFDGAHVRPGLHDGADGFVAQRQSGSVSRKVGLVEVQVGSADPGGGHFNDRPVGAGQCRIGPGVDADAARPVDDDRAHSGGLTFFVHNEV